MEASAILDLPMEPNDSKANTIRGYLKALLVELWVEEEGFDGERPFGNGGWQRDLTTPLVKFGVIEGSINADGDPSGYSGAEAEAVILRCILAL